MPDFMCIAVGKPSLLLSETVLLLLGLPMFLPLTYARCEGKPSKLIGSQGKLQFVVQAL